MAYDAPANGGLTARAREKRIRAVVFGVIVVGVLVAAGSLLYSVFSRPKLQALAGNVIDVAADMSGFDTKLIRVKVGQAVTIRLTSLDNSHHTDGGGKHQWAQEGDHPGAGDRRLPDRPAGASAHRRARL